MRIDSRLIVLGRTPEVSPRALQRRCERGLLVRIRPAVYVPAEVWRAADDRERFVLRTHALVAVQPAAVLSHRSAAVVHGLPLIGRMPLRPETLESRIGRSRSSGSVTRRTSQHPAEPVNLGDAVSTSLERTLVDLAATLPFRHAVPAVDAALRRGVPASALLAELQHAPPPGHRRARLAVSWADGDAANAGESFCRATVLELGFPPPLLQMPVPGLPYETDFGWPEWRRRGEFDGLRKYSEAEFREGRTPAEVVIDEKRREDAIRAATGHSFVRWTWDDVLRVEPVRRSLLAAGLPQGRWRATARPAV